MQAHWAALSATPFLPTCESATGGSFPGVPNVPDFLTISLDACKGYPVYPDIFRRTRKEKSKSESPGLKVKMVKPKSVVCRDKDGKKYGHLECLLVRSTWLLSCPVLPGAGWVSESTRRGSYRSTPWRQQRHHSQRQGVLAAPTVRPGLPVPMLLVVCIQER